MPSSSLYGHCKHMVYRQALTLIHIRISKSQKCYKKKKTQFLRAKFQTTFCLFAPLPPVFETGLTMLIRLTLNPLIILLELQTCITCLAPVTYLKVPGFLKGISSGLSSKQEPWSSLKQARKQTKPPIPPFTNTGAGASNCTIANVKTDENGLSPETECAGTLILSAFPTSRIVRKKCLFLINKNKTKPIVIHPRILP